MARLTPDHVAQLISEGRLAPDVLSPGAAAPEHEHQVALVAWARIAQLSRPELGLLFAIPNGGGRDKRTAGRLKAEGVRAGVPDLCLAVARGAWHGLFVEMKSATGTLSAEQLWWAEQLAGQGYAVITCRGFDEAKAAIERYLDEVAV
jgi:hypothetical protein